MHKDSAFQLVRSGDAVLWAGAGLSLYAGYPKASDLAKLLHKDLTPKQQKDISEHLSLEVLAEEFERAKNRKALILSLSKAFKEPSSFDLHTKIASIPQFRTIITTNYDPLFELAYGDRCQKITNQLQVPSIDERKVQILKIHGDLMDTQGLVLTKSDYTNFFSSESNNQLWNVVKERIATKSIIFIGYGFEDPNISFIFEKISDALGQTRKQAFYVAPLAYTPPHKQRYLKKKGITYINSTAETFIDELESDILKNFFSDYSNRVIPTDVYHEFLALRNLAPSLKGGKEHFKYAGIHPIEGEVEVNMSFTVKKDKKLIETLNEFASGRRFGELTITEELLIDSSFKIGDLLLPGSHEPNSSITFRSQPNKESIFDISFPNGFEITRMKSKVFASQHLAEAHVSYKSLSVVVRLKFSNIRKVTFSLTIQEPYERTQDAIELLTLLNLLYKGETFTIYLESGKTIDQHLVPEVDKSQHVKSLLNYFNKLREIEAFFKIRFTNIKGIDKSTHNTVDFVHEAIKGQRIPVKGYLTIHNENLSLSELEGIKTRLNAEDKLLVDSPTEEVIELHGQKLNLGHCKIEVFNPYITNYDELAAGKSKTFAIASKTHKAISTYFTGPIG